MACCGLPFRDTWCSVPDVCKNYLVWNDWCIWYCFCIYPLSRMFLSMEYLSNNRLDLEMSPWTNFIEDLHTKLRIISNGAPGSVTDSSCAVWCRWWTTCILVHFKVYSFKWQLECKPGIAERNVLIFLLFVSLTLPKVCPLSLLSYN